MSIRLSYYIILKVLKMVKKFLSSELTQIKPSLIKKEFQIIYRHGNVKCNKTFIFQETIIIVSKFNAM